jgi:hypothetical protein
MNVNAPNPLAAVAVQTDAAQTARQLSENAKPSISAPKAVQSLSRYAERQSESASADPHRGQKVNKKV